MEEILNYIKTEIEKGFSEKEIKAALSKAGHDADVIEDAIKEFYSQGGKSIIREEKKLIQFLNKKYIFLTLVVLLLISLIFIINLISKPQTRELAAITLAIQEKNCSALKYNVCSALVKNDINECSDTLLNGADESCKNEYLYYDSFLNPEKDKCKELFSSESRKTCQAKVQNDISRCYELENPTTCKAIFTLDITACSKIIGEDKESCIHDITFLKAIKTQDIALCKNLNSSYDQESCKAKIENDLSICDSLNSKACQKIINRDKLDPNSKEYPLFD